MSKKVYLALQSAASSLGSNPQALQVTQVMTKLPRRPLEIGRIRILFFVKRTVEQTPTQPLANAYAPLQVSTPEATALDLVQYAARIGGIGRVAETILPLLPLMRPAELRRVLKIEAEPATAQRLGFLLEKLWAADLAQAVHHWLRRNCHGCRWYRVGPGRLRKATGGAFLTTRWSLNDDNANHPPGCHSPKIPFTFPFRDAVVSTQVNGYDLHEMLGTKLRALFQRRRGRDLFDLYWALTLAKPAVVPAQVIESFQHYLKMEGSVAGRAEFILLLDAHLADRGFCSEMSQLLRAGITYDPQQAGDEVKTKLLSLLPAR